MVRAPDWSKSEFEILLNSYGLSPEELARKLPGRSPGAIGWVRGGIHSFHRGGNVSMLSQMMLRRLEEGRGSLTCPKCGMKF